MTRAPWTLWLLTACLPPDTAWPGPAWDTGSGAPTVLFTFPEEDLLLPEGQALTVQARVEDDGPLDQLVVRVTEDDALVQPSWAADGVLSWSTTVQRGAHEAVVEVVDADGLQASDRRHWTGAALPQVDVLEPTDGDTLDGDAPWTLRIALSDPDVGPDAAWQVEVRIDGATAAEERVEGAAPLAQELRFELPPLGPGEHQVEARIDDGTGSATARITLYGV